MPEIILIILLILSVFIHIFCVPWLDEGKFIPTIFCSIFTVLMFGWTISYSNTEWEYIDLETNVKTINNIDVGILDGKVINLNQKFGRDFSDGEKLTVKKQDCSRTYFGIFPLERDFPFVLKEN